MGKRFQYRFERHQNGCVPSVGRTPEQQLAYLDQKGFVATRERAKLIRKIEAAKAKPPVKEKK